MRPPKHRPPIVFVFVLLLLLGAAVGGVRWFVQVRARGEAESRYDRITRLYANKDVPPSHDSIHGMFLELVDEPASREVLARLDAEQAGIAYDGSQNAVYFIHARQGSRFCLGRACKNSELGRGEEHSGFPEFLSLQMLDVSERGVSLQFAVAGDEALCAAIERYGLEPGIAYVTTFEDSNDPIDLTGLARRARRM